MRPPSLSVAPVYYAGVNAGRTYTGRGIPGRTVRIPSQPSAKGPGGILAASQASLGKPYGFYGLTPAFPNNRGQGAASSGAPGAPSPAAGGCDGCG